jgi:hypothetical protein
LLSLNSFALESETDRKKSVTPRNARFYKSERSRSYIALNGKYSSNERSKEKEIRSRYLYQSNKYIHQINFLNETYHTNKGTKVGTRHLIKRKEVYDISLSTKSIIANTDNYLVAFHRTIYDDMSDYYRDMQTTVGFGRRMLNQAVELDFGVGYKESKNYSYNINFSPSWRAQYKITKKLTFNQRGFLFIDHEVMDAEIKTGLMYRLNKKLSFEIRHNFDQRRYADKKEREVVNKIRKTVTFGIVYHFD